MPGPDADLTFTIEEVDALNASNPANAQRGPNDPRTQGQSESGSGSEAGETLSSFSVVRSLIENEERILGLMRRRNAGFEQLVDPPNIQGGQPLKGDARTGQSRGPYRTNSAPLIMTTESFAAQGRYIIFWAGPRTVQWNFPMRAAQQQTRSGTIYHAWRNGSRENTFFDEPTVTFTLQAGNIMPVRLRRTESAGGITLTGEVAALPAGLFDFYEFFDLLNEPKILSDGRPNFVLIAYHSLVYPEIFMRGFFNPEGIQFSEDAQNPAELSWTAAFKVRSTSPPFYNSSQLLAAWRSAFTGTGTIQNLIPGNSSNSGSGAQTPGTGG